MNPIEPPDDLDPTRLEGVRLPEDEANGADPQIGACLGAFRLQEFIGKGGMGTVYLAEQVEPVQRQVALKLLRGSLRDPILVARFSVERQALARMSHPAIAQVYDAGTTHDGRPYFAMEHVPGAPITEFCDRRRLALRQRLELFAKVCWGVQHAHHKGIIHRDLKPNNILAHVVDEQPSPKIIDFGIATATDAAGDELEAGRRSGVGTPAYMSPEQASVDGADLDTRTDVYSLGAVLYELITGGTPVEAERLRDTTREELRQLLVDTDVESPSQRLRRTGADLEMLAATAAERRRLMPRLRIEVDRIVLKALATEPAARYDTASALAQDIEAFLDGRPVAAVPPTVRYRLTKLAKRHKALLAGTGVATLALLVGLALATWGFLQARQQRDRAREAEAQAKIEAAKSTQIAGFTQGILSGVDPAVAGDLDKTLLRRLLIDAAAKIDVELEGQPEVAGAIHHTIGITYSALAEYDPAEEHLTAARTLLEQELGADDPQTLVALVELALNHRRQGHFEAAEELLLEATAGLRAARGDEHEETLAAIDNLASLRLWQGRFAEAETLYLEALEGSRRALGPDHQRTMSAANNLALLYSEQGRFDEAEPLYLEVLERSREVLGSEHPETLTSLNNLAALLEQQGRLEEAERLYQEALDGSRRVLGPDHRETLNVMNNVAVLYSNQGRLQEAADLHRQVLAGSHKALGANHPDTINSISNLAFVLNKLGRKAEAAEMFADAADAARRNLPPDSTLTAGILSNYGGLLTDLGRYSEAEQVLRESLDRFERILGADHGLTLMTAGRLDELYERWQR